MATSTTFSFTTRTINDNDVYSATFQSSDGEVYVVKYNRAVSRINHRHVDYSHGSLTLEWKKQSSRCVKVSIFNENDYQFKSDKKLFAKDAVKVSFALENSKDSVIIISITGATRVHLLEKHRPSEPNPADKMLRTTTEEKTITEKKLEQLSTDMGDFLKTGNLSDVVLTDGSKEIRAHKLMLSARSSVFAKMFLHPMKENRENRITIQDISIEVLRELLQFMYSGTVIIKGSKMARDLYVAADKYDVKELKDICTAMLKSADLNNVLDTLLLADLYSDKVLKEAALHFVSQNYSQVKALQNWNSFMKENQTLAIEILSFLVDKRI